MTEPDDRELEQYLKGNSPLSRRYGEASGETAPPELDEAILARRAVRLRPLGVNRWLTPLALAASVVLGINLGWNVYKAAPVPDEASAPQELLEVRDQSVTSAHAKSAAEAPMAPAPAPTPVPGAERKAPAASPAEGVTSGSAHERALVQKQTPPLRRNTPAGASADSAAAPAAAAPLSEPEKIDRLINAVGNLDGATFVRNGKDYGATEAAKHLQLKREKAGDRVRTADDFIRLCASHSYLSGEAYLIRFADGRTRTAEDVLREELARIEGR